MNVGVLGTGAVGRALGNAFVALGHPVKMGSRTAGNDNAVLWARQAGPKASQGTFTDAARFGDLIVLATLGTAAEAAIRAAGVDNFDGKIVVDTTNPLEFSSGTPRLSIGHTDSLGERVQRLLPRAHIVKAFNTVGNAHMFRPQFPGGPPDMFVCGNDEGAKGKVAALLRDFGWGVVDIGGIEGARHLEPMCMVWVLHGVRSGSWNHAFKMLQR